MAQRKRRLQQSGRSSSSERLQRNARRRRQSANQSAAHLRELWLHKQLSIRSHQIMAFGIH